jgi:hypothetical protein
MICQQCNKEFIKKRSRKFCSEECVKIYRQKYTKELHKKRYIKKEIHGNKKYFTEKEKAEAIKRNRNNFNKTEKAKINKSKAKYSIKYYYKQKEDTQKYSQYKMIHNLRKRLREVAKQKKAENTRAGSGSVLFGCSYTQLRNHLKKQFKDGMSWKNYGDWHIDHIIPMAKFDMNVIDQRNKCFHYSNLQPLWAVDNLKKGKKF